MAQPSPYNRQFSFTNFSSAFPSTPLPGQSVDGELNAVQQTLAQVLANLALIQRDDGAIANGSIGTAQLSSAITVGFTVPTVWQTGVAYITNPASTVFHGAAFYSCRVAHTAGTFATDLAAGKWLLILDLSSIPIVAASQVPVTPAGGIIATNVQDALVALDSGKAATSHTHTVAQISDSTSLGRQFLQAVNLAAIDALLGLGSLAFQDSVSTTTLATVVNLSGTIVPTTLSGNVNDWNPTGWSAASSIQASANTPVSITGLAGGVEGRIAVITVADASSNITLTNADSGSVAANRFILPKNFALRQKQGITLIWHQANAAGAGGWSPVVNMPSHPISGSFRKLAIVPGGTPNKQMTITADALTVEDANGEVARLSTVNVTVDGTVQNGANGTDGAYAISGNAWYSLWVIYNPTTNTVAGLIATSATAPTLPSGYTYKARVGWALANSANFLRTQQYGRRATYVTPIQVQNGVVGTYSDSTPTWQPLTITSQVPVTACVVRLFIANNFNGGSAANVICAPNSSYSGPTSSVPPPLMIRASTVGCLQGEFILESGSSIQFASSASGGLLSIAGWEDNI